MSSLLVANRARFAISNSQNFPPKGGTHLHDESVKQTPPFLQLVAQVPVAQSGPVQGATHSQAGEPDDFFSTKQKHMGKRPKYNHHLQPPSTFPFQNSGLGTQGTRNARQQNRKDNCTCFRCTSRHYDNSHTFLDQHLEHTWAMFRSQHNSRQTHSSWNKQENRKNHPQTLANTCMWEKKLQRWPRTRTLQPRRYIRTHRETDKLECCNQAMCILAKEKREISVNNNNNQQSRWCNLDRRDNQALHQASHTFRARSTCTKLADHTSRQ